MRQRQALRKKKRLADDARALKLLRRDDFFVRLLPPELDQTVASTGFAVLRDIDERRVSRDYLWGILRSGFCLDQMLQRASGGNYPAITESELGRILVPLPDAATQTKIAGEITHRRAEARALRVKAESEWRQARAIFENELLGVDLQ